MARVAFCADQFAARLPLQYARERVNVPARLSVYKTSFLFTGAMTHGCYGEEL